jgi:hypothetical protein
MTAIAMADWRPIKTAPHDGTRILLGFDYLEDIVLVGLWVNNDWEWTTRDTLGLSLRPTHWQPLVSPRR